jgi:hypothetical protein
MIAVVAVLQVLHRIKIIITFNKRKDREKILSLLGNNTVVNKLAG